MQTQIVIDEWKKAANRCQKEWSKILFAWKCFKPDQTQLVKTYVGLGLFGFPQLTEENSAALQHYHRCYNATQQKRIEVIFNQISHLCRNEIVLGHTYLYLSEHGIVYCLFRCKTNNSIYFIEPTGRTYNSWSHFLETNKLPACYFVSPKNGIYEKNVSICCYQTPSFLNSNDKTGKTMEWMCTIAGIGCTLMGLCTLAPSLVTSTTSMSLGVRNFYKAAVELLDINEHHQVDGLNSVENSLSLISVLAAVPGSSVTEILAMLGDNGSYIMKFIQSLLNITNKLIDSGTWGTTVLFYNNRLKSGDFQFIDAVELASHTFVLYGAVTNVQHLHDVITKRPNQVFELDSKFDPWRRRLINNEVSVTMCSPIIAIKLLTHKNPDISFQVLRQFYPKERVILNTLFELKHSVLDYLSQKKSTNDFCSLLCLTIQDLWKILEKDLNNIGPWVKFYVSNIKNISEWDFVNISKLLIKVMLKIRTLNDTPSLFPIVVRERCYKHRTIFKLAKSHVIENNVYFTVTDVIQAFYNSISHVTSSIEKIVADKQKALIDQSTDNEILNEILPRMSVLSVDHFYHQDNIFYDAIQTYNNEYKYFDTIDHSSVPLSEELVDLICDGVILSFEKVYENITTYPLSISDMKKLIMIVCQSVCEFLIGEYPKTKERRKHQFITQFRSFCSSGVITAPDKTLMEEELNSFNETCSALPVETLIPNIQVHKIEINREITDDEFLYILLSVCENVCKVAETMNNFDNSKESVKKVYYFTLIKFLNSVSDSLNSETRSESDYLSPLSETVEKFYDNKFLTNFVNQFSQFEYDSNVYDKIRIWKELSSDYLIHFVHCVKSEFPEFYQLKASELFDVDFSKYEIKINFNSVFLKSVERFVVFYFIENVDGAIVCNFKLKWK